MSAYRHLPPPPRWRVLYRSPLRDRLGRSGVVALFSAIVVLGLVTTIAAPILGGMEALAIAMGGFLAALSAATFLVIVWMTRLPEIAERTITEISDDGRRCRVISEGERWTLPMSAEKLRVGQKIRVSFREIAPESDLEPGREVIEVRTIEE